MRKWIDLIESGLADFWSAVDKVPEQRYRGIWILPDGSTHDCEYGADLVDGVHHQDVAERILGGDEHHAMDQGWLRARISQPLVILEFNGDYVTEAALKRFQQWAQTAPANTHAYLCDIHFGGYTNPTPLECRTLPELMHAISITLAAHKK